MRRQFNIQSHRLSNNNHDTELRLMSLTHKRLRLAQAQRQDQRAAVEHQVWYQEAKVAALIAQAKQKRLFQEALQGDLDRFNRNTRLADIAQAYLALGAGGELNQHIQLQI